MPTTEPLDAYDLTSDEFGGQLKSIARTADAGTESPAPAAGVPVSKATAASATATISAAAAAPRAIVPPGVIVAKGGPVPPGVTIEHLGPRPNYRPKDDLASFRRPSLRRDPEAEKAAEEHRNAQPVVNNAFTDEALKAAWQKFIDDNHTEVILVNTMRAALPVRKADKPNALHITVENAIQVELIKENMPLILAHLHSALNNNLITLTADFNAERGSTYTWNDREVLSAMVGHSPTLKSLIDKMSMKLS